MRLSLVFLLLVFALGCSKDDDPGFTSALGSWTYTTPDESIKVNFDLTGGGTGEVLNIQNQVIFVNGTQGNAEKEIKNVDLPNIESIRINANDAKLVYSYYIIFKNLKVSEDFKSINVEEMSYTVPDGAGTSLNNIQTLNNVQITRAN